MDSPKAIQRSIFTVLPTSKLTNKNAVRFSCSKSDKPS